MTPVANGPLALKATLGAVRLAAPVSSRLSGYLAARLWFTPWRLPLGERAVTKQDAWLTSTRPLEVEADGLLLKGYEGGSGPTVLLVHGWGDSSRSMGAFAKPLIDAGFRVVGMDMPGHGATSGGQTDALQIAAAVRALAQRVGPVHGVIAHSMGAYGTMLALHDGLAAEKVVLISPAVLLESAVAPFGEMFALSRKTIKGLRREIERRFGPSVWTDLAADRLVRDVDIPALIVHDPEDPQVPFVDTERLVRSWRTARVEPSADLGHTRILRSDTVIDRAVSYLTQDEGAASVLRADGLVPARV